MANGNVDKKKPRKLLTTGDIGELLGFHPKTVADWIDRGILPGIQFPDGRNSERRVHRDVFRAFCVKLDYAWAIRDLDAEEGIAAPPPPAEEKSPEARAKPARSERGPRAKPKPKSQS